MHFTLYTHFLQLLQELGPEAAAKKIISLLLCVALCFALAACGGSDYTSERKLAEKQNEAVDKGSDTYEIKAEKFSALTGYTVVYPDGNEQLPVGRG